MLTCSGPCYHHREMTTMTTTLCHHHCTPTLTTMMMAGWHHLCHQIDDDNDDNVSPPPPHPHVNNNNAPPSRPHVNNDDETCPGHTTITAQCPRPHPQWATSCNNNKERVWRDDAPSPSLLPSPSVSSSQVTLCDNNDALSPSLPSPHPHPYSYPCIPHILLVTNIYLFLLLLE